MEEKVKLPNSSLMTLLIVTVLLIALNISFSNSNKRWDLTEEKRFTLSESTKTIAGNLDKNVEIYVFLEDKDLPSGFKRLQQATRDILSDIKSSSKSKVRVYFENPLEGLSNEEREQTRIDLVQRGVVATDIELKTKDGSIKKQVFPYALINYDDKQIPVNLLSGSRGQEDLNRSIALLEYKFANALSKISDTELPIIGWLKGHGELEDLEIYDLQKSLFEQYFLSQNIDLDSMAVLPQELDALVIARPTQPLSEAHKFSIDQYMMNGGKTLWAVDVMKMNLDSLKTEWGGRNVAVDFDLNIDDILFNSGVRINRDLLRDLQSKPVPIVVDESGQSRLLPWTLYPLLSGNDHPITSNIDPVSIEFGSSIDVLERPGIESTVLLQSSSQAGVVANPVLVDLDELANPPDPALFGRQNIPMAVLLEGSFTSLYKNRATPDGFTGQRRDKSPESGRMIVVADGDIARNPVLPGGQTLPLGYDRALRENFGNKAFMQNALEYLVYGDEVLQSRNKEVELRLLNRTKVESEKGKWQVLNMALPISFILLFGLIFYLLRKRRYS